MEHESNTAHRVNQLRSLIGIDLPPQAGDVHVDDVVERCGTGGLSPDVSRQALARDHLALMSQQVFEQLELTRGELHRMSAAQDLARNQIQLQIRGGQPGELRGAPAPDECANPRHELRERERLDHVVVGARVETEHTILERVARRQHKDRRLDAAVPQGFQDLETVPARQREIQQNGVELLGRDAEERAFARALDDHVVSLAEESLAQGVGDLQLVFDDENAHSKE
jgi:hypothetical protein